MQIDGGFEGRLEALAGAAQTLDRLGLHRGLWVSDTQNDPFLLASTALAHSRRLQVGTNVAVAFARSPYVVAQTAWNLAHLSQGRFLLGLGSQIKPHIEKRFSMPWPASPVRAMEEYLALLRHLFERFRDRQSPHFRGEYYTCRLANEVFFPDPHPFPAPLLGLSAVGQAMTRLAGRAADVVLLHPFTHLTYLRQVTLPALQAGIAQRPAERPPLQVIGSVFVVPEDHHESAAWERRVRERLAFYASTPNYAAVLETLGFRDLQERLQTLSRQGRWSEMGSTLPTDLVEACLVRAPRERLAEVVRARFEGIYDRAILDVDPWLTPSSC